MVISLPIVKEEDLWKIVWEETPLQWINKLLKNNKLIQSALSDLKKLSKVKIAKKKLSFKFESEFLNYQPFLKEFSSQHYKIFNEISYQLDLQGSIVDLFEGEVVNKTEIRHAPKQSPLATSDISLRVMFLL